MSRYHRSRRTPEDAPSDMELAMEEDPRSAFAMCPDPAHWNAPRSSPYRLCSGCGRKEYDKASSDGDACDAMEPGGSACRGVLGMRWFPAATASTNKQGDA